MTITHQASTGLPAVTTDPSPYDAAYPATGAGWIAVQFITTRGPVSAAVDLTSMADSWTTVGSNFNATVGHDDTGATSDAGLTKVTCMYRVLTGTETTNFTYTTTVATNTAAQCMSVYSTDSSGGWIVPSILVSGVDDVHGTDRASTTGTWATATAPGDLLVWGFSSDTDTALTITAPTCTQTSSTIGTITHRNRRLNGQGGDCAVYSFDAPLTAGGNTNALSLGFTTATNQCGAVVGVRLREAPPAAAYPPRRRGPNYRR